jgi:NDP-sugar pyrophosphorylase family protein
MALIIKSAIILAGGKGTRLGELGLQTQKCMLPIRGIPLLRYVVNQLKNVGCCNIILVVNHLSEQVKGYFAAERNLGINIRYIEGFFPSTFSAITHSLQFVDDAFFYCHGNVLFEDGTLENMLSEYRLNLSNTLMVSKSHDNVTHAKLQVINGQIVSATTSKNSYDTSQLNRTFLGLAIYKKQSILLSNNDESNLDMTEAHIIHAKHMRTPCYAIDYNKEWIHIENIQDYTLAEKSKLFGETNYE